MVRRITASLLVALTMIGVIAPAANAFTTLGCRYQYAPGVRTTECYRDYAWWEFKRDGWYVVSIKFL